MRGNRPVRRRANILLILIVILPVGVMAWLGNRLAGDESDALSQRLQELLTGQLRDVDQIVVRFFDELKHDLRDVADLPALDSATVRAKLRKAPLARQILVLDEKGRLLHPNPSQPMNSDEHDFLNQAHQLLDDRDLVRAAEQASGTTGDDRLTSESDTSTSVSETEGWYVWYYGRGVNLIYWQRLESGKVVAVAAERGRWLADLNSALPHTDVASASQEVSSRVRLVDSIGRPMYQFGAFEPEETAEPTTQVAVSEPLTSWRLQAFVPADMLSGAQKSTYFNVVASLIAAFVTIAVLAAFFWREYSREVREASQRVSFVNQVSHELKTPLTNIRMYADLLENDLDNLPDIADANGEPESVGPEAQDTPSPKSRLKVIVSESQRLSRLIGNVLTFAKQQRNALQLQARPAVVDQTIRTVLDQFEVALGRHKIVIEFSPSAPEAISVDVDALEQILVNLISNVEKYATDGKLLAVSTQQTKAGVTIHVSDLGPGIPLDQQEKVFQPFSRLSNNIEDVAGTGIGLSIARELAQLMSGSLKIVPSEHGSTFEVVLPSGPASTNG
jgi:signal transduction histidine kinase